MKILIVSPFYDKTPQREQITSLQFKNYRNLRKYFSKKYGNKIEICFLLIGSENKKSLNLVLNNGFSSNEYCEFDQSPYSSVYDIIEQKYIYGMSIARQRHPDMDILFINGSNDIVDYAFYENAIYNNLKDRSPHLYGINGFKKGGSSYFCENNIKNILVLNDRSFNNRKIYLNELINNNDNVFQAKTQEIYNSNNNERKKMNLLQRLEEEKQKQLNIYFEDLKHIDYIHSTAFIGGIYGFNRQLLEKMNYRIILPKGDEYKMEESCLRNGAKIIYCLDYFINFKASSSDVTPFYLIDRLYGPLQVRLNELDDRIRLFFKRIMN